MTAELAIRARGLSKHFGTLRAVSDLDLDVPRACIYGFLGPNGAGKTTTLRMLTGFLPPSSGAARIAGHDIFRESIEVRKRIGYMPENVPLYTEMRVKEYLRFRGGSSRTFRKICCGGDFPSMVPKLFVFPTF